MSKKFGKSKLHFAFLNHSTTYPDVILGIPPSWPDKSKSKFDLYCHFWYEDESEFVLMTAEASDIIFIKRRGKVFSFGDKSSL